ncbi:MAG: DUF72 domain-containing protein [Marmoricola sp.]
MPPTAPSGNRPTVAQRRGGQIRVGTSGWRYDTWRGDFYPADLARDAELGYLGTRLPTVELNATFYALQRPSSFRRWHEETPDDFVFAVKGSRFITHLKRLRDVGTALPNFLASGVLTLEHKLGPFLWQLPERVEFDEPTLRAFLAQLPRSTAAASELAARHDDRVKVPATDDVADQADLPIRHAVEVRNTTFLVPGFVDLLTRYDVACVRADSGGRWPELDVTTASFDYVRLHGHSQLYTSRYADRTLERYAESARESACAGRDVYVYLDNDAHGHAPHDAVRLRRMVA